MSIKTGISWTDSTWNPVRGCTRVSEGCRFCYAERVAARFSGPGLPYEGLASIKNGEARWTGEVRVIEKHLADPLRWKEPRRIFVNSMSDLFHEKLSNEAIAAVFGVMTAAPLHKFQVLTKRAVRMRAWFAWVDERGGIGRYIRSDAGRDALRGYFDSVKRTERVNGRVYRQMSDPWMQVMNGAACNFSTAPLHNVWLGVSVEDQKTADERIPLLLDTPAVIRFVSAEPLLEAVDLTRFFQACAMDEQPFPREDAEGNYAQLHWVIVGGESGRCARPCAVSAIRSIVDQCRSADVSCFVKQCGARPHLDPWQTLANWPEHVHCDDGDIDRIVLRSRPGADPDEWPLDLRVQEFPEAVHA